MIYVSTKSKIKPKLKPKAERDQYAAWCAKHGIDPLGKTKKKPIKVVVVPGVVTKKYIRETPHIPSLNAVVLGAVNTNQKSQVYTGTKMIGVATMHKSNMVPIFNDETAVDVSQMRR